MKSFKIEVMSNGVIHVDSGTLKAQYPPEFMNKTIIDFMYEMGEAEKEAAINLELNKEIKLSVDNLKGLVDCGTFHKDALPMAQKVLEALNIKEYDIRQDLIDSDRLNLYIRGTEDLVDRFWIRWESMVI